MLKTGCGLSVEEDWKLYWDALRVVLSKLVSVQYLLWSQMHFTPSIRYLLQLQIIWLVTFSSSDVILSEVL